MTAIGGGETKSEIREMFPFFTEIPYLSILTEENPGKWWGPPNTKRNRKNLRFDPAESSFLT